MLNKIFGKILRINANHISIKSKEDIEIDKKGMKDVITHLHRVLAKEVDIKEKVKKPVNQIGYIRYGSIQYYQNLFYNTMNQFHPKFLEKLPQRVQFYIHKAMRYMVERLTQEFEKFS